MWLANKDRRFYIHKNGTCLWFSSLLFVVFCLYDFLTVVCSICSISSHCVACFFLFTLFLWQHATCHPPVAVIVSECQLLQCGVGIDLFSLLSSLTSPFIIFLLLFFDSPCSSVLFLTLHMPLSNSWYHLSLLFHFPGLPPVSISPPGAGPQLCGVPVLLPTWAERLFPPGPLPGANDRAVPGHPPLQLVQPQ